MYTTFSILKVSHINIRPGNMFDHVEVVGKFVCWRLLRRAVVSPVGHFGQVREQFLRSQGVGGE